MINLMQRLQPVRALALVTRRFLQLAVLFVLFGVLPHPASAVSGSGSGYLAADRVLVVKSERRLYLLRDSHVLKSYPIQLGRSPVGDKVFEGDGRTPEGLYILDRRNNGSKYYRSIRISYPNQNDIAEAREYGRRPGGLVMIHGQPNYAHVGYTDARSWDWTEGCIAVSNAAMDEIWDATTYGTPIEILP